MVSHLVPLLSKCYK